MEHPQPRSSSRRPQQPHRPTRNLFIAGFRDDATDGTLRDIFGQFGRIESAKVMLDIHSGASRGFGFVLFSELENAVRACEHMNGALMHGTDVVSGPPPPSTQQQGTGAAAGQPGDSPPPSSTTPPPAAARPSSSTVAGAGGGGGGGAAPARQHPPEECYRLAVQFAKHDAFNVVTQSTKVYCRNIPTTMREADLQLAIESVIGEGSVAAISVHPDSERSPALYDRERGRLGTASPSTPTAPATGRPKANVAFIEFHTIEDAQRAVDRTYRLQLPGPGSEGPLLTKFAETAEVRSERRKRTQFGDPVEHQRAASGLTAGGGGAPPPMVPPALPPVALPFPPSSHRQAQAPPPPLAGGAGTAGYFMYPWAAHHHHHAAMVPPPPPPGYLPPYPTSYGPQPAVGLPPPGFPPPAPLAAVPPGGPVATPPPAGAPHHQLPSSASSAPPDCSGAASERDSNEQPASRRQPLPPPEE